MGDTIAEVWVWKWRGFGRSDGIEVDVVVRGKGR